MSSREHSRNSLDVQVESGVTQCPVPVIWKLRRETEKSVVAAVGLLFKKICDCILPLVMATLLILDSFSSSVFLIIQIWEPNTLLANIF